MREIRLPELTRQQQIFMDADEREQLYGGAKRGGKTFAGCVKVWMLCYFYPGNRVGIFRKEGTDLRDSTLVTLFKVIPPELIYSHNKSERTIELLTSQPGVHSTIIYRGLGDKDDYEKSKGIDLGGMWIDEPSEVEEAAFLMLRAQLNWVLPNGQRPPYMCILTSNPEPGWVKRRYQRLIDNPGSDGKAIFVPALPKDNRFLPPGYEQELRESYDENWVRKYLEGSWEVSEGMVFTELDHRVHDLNAYIPAGTEFPVTHLKMIGCLDHATTGITAYLLVGFDPDENLYVVGEYYLSNMLISQHAQGIHSLKAFYQRPEYELADPSTEAKTIQGQHELFSVIDEYSRHGLRLVPAHRANIYVGINLLKELLHFNPQHINPFTQERGSPRLFIDRRRCPNLWREMTELKQEPKPDGTIVYVGSDHALDCVRYIAMSRPKAPARRALDTARLPTVDQQILRTHDKWAANFGKKNTGRWMRVR